MSKPKGIVPMTPEKQSEFDRDSDLIDAQLIEKQRSPRIQSNRSGDAEAASATSEIPRWTQRFGPLLSRDELADIPKPQTLIGPYLQAGGVNLLHGLPGSGKSFICLDWACSIATGTDWCAWPVEQGTVIYWALEGKGGLDQRITAWEQGHGRAVPAERFIVPSQSPTLDFQEHVEDLTAMTVELKPTLLVVDTAGRAKGALSENKEEEFGLLFTQYFPRITERTGTTILPVHHQGHEGESRGRGTSAMRANVDHEYETKSTDLKGKLHTVTLNMLRAKDAERERPLEFSAIRAAASIVLIRADPASPSGKKTNAETAADAIRKLADDNQVGFRSKPITTAELVAETGLDGRRLSDITDDELEAAGVTRSRSGRGGRGTKWWLID